MPDQDLLVLMGVIKQLLRMIDAGNTRDIAVLAYYDNQTTFVYQSRFERGERVEFNADGQFSVTRLPHFFKVRVDSDLSTLGWCGSGEQCTSCTGKRISGPEKEKR